MRTCWPWAFLGPGSEAGGGETPHPVGSEVTLLTWSLPQSLVGTGCSPALSASVAPSYEMWGVFQRCSPGPRANEELQRGLELAASGPRWCRHRARLWVGFLSGIQASPVVVRSCSRVVTGPPHSLVCRWLNISSIWAHTGNAVRILLWPLAYWNMKRHILYKILFLFSLSKFRLVC